jgi:hypothetical protein
MTNPEALDSLVLQRPESQAFVNVTVNVNEDPEPYALLVNCFLILAHLFPYALVVALAVRRS